MNALAMSPITPFRVPPNDLTAPLFFSLDGDPDIHVYDPTPPGGPPAAVYLFWDWGFVDPQPWDIDAVALNIQPNAAGTDFHRHAAGPDAGKYFFDTATDSMLFSVARGVAAGPIPNSPCDIYKFPVGLAIGLYASCHDLGLQNGAGGANLDNVDALATLSSTNGPGKFRKIAAGGGCVCDGDIVGTGGDCEPNGVVDISDVLAVTACFQTADCPCGPEEYYDVDCDGDLDQDDVDTVTCLFGGATPEMCCPQACCLADDTCNTVTPDQCDTLSGTPMGDGTVCSALEVCCAPGGDCEMIDPICCENAGGSPRGAGTTCSAVEACCLADGGCVSVDPHCCNALEGTRLGPGTACAEDGNGNGVDDACESGPIGACCIPEVACVVTSQALCDELEWDYLGEDTSCPGDADEDGIAGPCEENPIPTVSTWGNVIMTLLVLTGATVLLTRRQNAQERTTA